MKSTIKLLFLVSILLFCSIGYSQNNVSNGKKYKFQKKSTEPILTVTFLDSEETIGGVMANISSNGKYAVGSLFGAY